MASWSAHGMASIPNAQAQPERRWRRSGALADPPYIRFDGDGAVTAPSRGRGGVRRRAAGDSHISRTPSTSLRDVGLQFEPRPRNPHALRSAVKGLHRHPEEYSQAQTSFLGDLNLAAVG